jgi:hypothetical protein
MALAATGLLLGVVAGCGAGGESSDDTAEESDDAEGAFESPLAELMGWQGESPEESRRKQLEVEDLVATCMREEGWEYIPVDYAAQYPEQDESIELQQDPEAFGEKYGYGVVYNYEQWEEPSLLGEENPRDVAFEDPNMAYVEGLTESETEAYYESLYGKAVASTVPAEEESTPVMVAPTDQGCMGRANAEVYGADPMMEDPDLQERLNEYFEDTQNDPRLADANAAWSECMGDELEGIEVAGQPIDGPDDVYGYIDQLKYKAMGLEIVPFDDSEGAKEDMYTAWTDEDGAGEAAIGEPQPISEGDLEELRALELDLWAKDWACQEEADMRAIRLQIEEDLVEELRAEFPELGSDDS